MTLTYDLDLDGRMEAIAQPDLPMRSINVQPDIDMVIAVVCIPIQEAKYLMFSALSGSTVALSS